MNLEEIKKKREEYYQRIIRLKPIILEDKTAIENTKSILKKVYKTKYLELPKEILFLGGGQVHQVYSPSSRKIIDPLSNKELYLAIRICPEIWKDDGLNPWLAGEIDAFEFAYAIGKNPPYFSGVVKFNDLQGIITEDVKKRKSCQTKDVALDSLERTNLDGTTERFFIDPPAADRLKEEKYYREEAIIEV